MAWIFIWAFLGLFCVIIAGFVSFGLWYKNTATDTRDANLKVIAGTVLIQAEDQPNWQAAFPEMGLKPGDGIKTDETSQALLSLFDGSAILLYPKTELRVVSLSSLKFVPNKTTISLFQKTGRTRVIVPPPKGMDRRFEIGLAQTNVSLTDGSFSFNLDGEVQQIKVRDGGKAIVSNVSGSMELLKGQRAELTPGKLSTGPEPSQGELVRNGNFSKGLDGWRAGMELGVPEGQDILGKVEAVTENGQSAVRFSRLGSKNTHSGTYIQQGVDADVADFTKLELSLDLKLVHQSLSGGGYQGSEYPILVRVNYLSTRGENFKVFGFYYQNEANNRTNDGVGVTQNIWEQYTVPDNLMETLSPPPLIILSIRVEASGWDYDSLVSSVSLLGE